MASRSNFKIESGIYGPVLVPTTTWDKGMTEYMSAKGIKELFLNYAWGWQGEDVSFLCDTPYLEAFSIIHRTINDISPVNKLHKLRYLKVHTYCKTEIDFAEFPRLRSCVLEWRAKAKSLFGCTSLEEVFVNGYSGKDTSSFSNLTNLRTLSIANAPIEDLRGLGSLHRLRSLRLYNLRKLPSLRGIEGLASIEGLEVNGCTSLTSIAEIGNLSNLRYLQLCDDRSIATIKPLQRLNKLESFFFYGNTHIVDGDLSPLLDLEHLSDTSFQERSHYSHTKADILQSSAVHEKDGRRGGV
jgi:Leucine-rich repeat (LRR) protein